MKIKNVFRKVIFRLKFPKKKQKGFNYKYFETLINYYANLKYWAKEHPELPFEPLIDKYKNEIITLLGKNC